MAIDLKQVVNDLERLATILNNDDCTDRVFFHDEYLDTLGVLKKTATKETICPFVEWYDRYFCHQMKVTYYGRPKLLTARSKDVA
jgi:hypothetical protein